MKKAFLIGLIFLGLTLSVAQPANAFGPVDGLKSGRAAPADDSLAGRWRALRQEMNQWREQWREARREALAKFLKLSRDEFEQRLKDGETPREIAEEEGVDVGRWREQRRETRREHLGPADIADEVIAAKEARIQERRIRLDPPRIR